MARDPAEERRGMKSLLPFLLITFLFFSFAAGGKTEEADTISVWIFTAIDCPIANGYAPELTRIQHDYESRGVEFLIVYPEPTLSKSEIEAHLAEYQLQFSYQHDSNHTLVSRSGATVTPEVVVFAPKDHLVYRGKIDNRYSEYGDRRNSATETYLRDVLDRLLSGSTVEFHETEAIGCFIEALAEN